MSLQSGKQIHRHGWTVLPITQNVINRVHYLAQKQGQPIIRGNFKYERDPDDEITDDTENEEGEEHSVSNDGIETIMPENEVRNNDSLEAWEPTFLGEHESTAQNQVSRNDTNVNARENTIIKQSNSVRSVYNDEATPVYETNTESNTPLLIYPLYLSVFKQFLQVSFRFC